MNGKKARMLRVEFIGDTARLYFKNNRRRQIVCNKERREYQLAKKLYKTGEYDAKLNDNRTFTDKDI